MKNKKTLINIFFFFTLLFISCGNNTQQIETAYKKLVMAARAGNSKYLQERLPFLSALSNSENQEMVSSFMLALKKDIPYKIKFESEDMAILQRNDGFILVFSRSEDGKWVVASDFTMKTTIDIIPAKK
ncbi:hypothetical protein WKV44_05705 [Spirochaetia bacterium 38H-sp]|uniref:DUF3887 domain-containing protein n=1 Tax=Rarispira pelagica TaxID=3141764 RepID=A0ABU9UC53_9SPIR